MYAMPWGLNTSANLNVNDGNIRVVTVNGPGAVYGGVTSSGAATTIGYGTLEFQERGSTRFSPTSLLDLGLQKVIQFSAAAPYPPRSGCLQRAERQHGDAISSNNQA